jgi:hypothetical protein
MLIKLIEELTEGLTTKQKRAWYRIVLEGKSITQTAASEQTSRQAILCRRESMIANNGYCEIASQWGALRERVNQHEFRALTPIPNGRRFRHSSRPTATQKSDRLRKGLSRIGPNILLGGNMSA